MKIGILGSGRMGGSLGTIFARSGHEVTFSYARTVGKCAALAAHVGVGSRAGSPADAVLHADMVLLAVHWQQLDDILHQAGNLAGKVVLSCCNPLDAEDTELVVGHTDSGAEALARRLPGARLVAAFQATPSEVLQPVFEARHRSSRPSQLLCGDDAAAKQLVARLIDQAGFDPVDAGALQVARYIEPFGMLSGVLAYDTGEGPEWTYRLGHIDRICPAE